MKNIVDWLYGLSFWGYLLVNLIVGACLYIAIWVWFKDAPLILFNRPKKGYWTIIGDVPIWVPGEEEDEDL